MDTKYNVDDKQLLKELNEFSIATPFGTSRNYFVFVVLE